MSDAHSQSVRLLVSVRNAHEATIAASSGVDIIDIKEPTRGPLGRADAKVVGEIVAAVAARTPVTMAMGELTEWIAAGESMAALEGISLVKMGLAKAPDDWRTRLRAAGFTSPSGDTCKTVAVAYADGRRVVAPSLHDVLSWAIEHRAAGLLIDTAVKDGRGLFEWVNETELSALIDRAHRVGLFVALAGSLAGESLRAAAALQPDIVAVRGAACTARDRNGSVDADAIAGIRRIIAPYSVSTARHAD